MEEKIITTLVFTVIFPRLSQSGETNIMSSCLLYCFFGHFCVLYVVSTRLRPRCIVPLWLAVFGYYWQFSGYFFGYLLLCLVHCMHGACIVLCYYVLYHCIICCIIVLCSPPKMYCASVARSRAPTTAFQG